MFIPGNSIKHIEILVSQNLALQPKEMSLTFYNSFSGFCFPLVMRLESKEMINSLVRDSLGWFVLARMKRATQKVLLDLQRIFPEDELYHLLSNRNSVRDFFG